MLLLLWAFTLLSVVATGWCLHTLQRKQKRLVKVQAAWQRATRKIHVLEKNHSGSNSHRETTEEKLRDYLQLMDVLVNAIPNPIYFKDMLGVFQGCNNMFAKSILGLTRDRIIGRRPQDLPEFIPAELAATYQRQELKMHEKQGLHSFEAPVQCADGERREYLFNLAQIRDTNGQPSGSVSILADLTIKNRAAQDRLQKEKLEGVLETAGAVCHELSQPLQALSGYTELLMAELAHHPAPQDYLNKIMEQIERMSLITAKLQGITRYETMDYADKTRIIDIHKASTRLVE